MRSITDAVGVSLQLAYEYPGWGPEHVWAMLDTYDATDERPPCNYDELYALAVEAAKLKAEGKSWAEAEEAMLKKHRR